MPTANEALYDLSVSHAVGLQRLAAQTARRIVGLLNRVDADLVRQLTESEGNWTAERLERLLAAVRDINRRAYQQVLDEMRGELTQLAEYEVGYWQRGLAQAVPIRVDIVSPAREQLVAAVTARPFQGRLLREWVDGLEAARYARLRDAVRISFVEGETIAQAVQRVRGTAAAGFADGVLEIDRRGAEALVRTAINHTATAARELMYQANSELIKGVRWVSTLDARTTEVCQARDGEVYEPGEGPRPPAHINCRSTTVPVVRSWKELGIDLNEAPAGTRASMDGQVPANMTYSEWLRTKPREFVEDVLGVSKAALFLEGDLDLSSMVNRFGKPLTLDQLRQREAAAFTRAGLGP